MRRPVFVLGLLAVLLAPVLALPRSAEACSGGPFDAIAEGDIAFAGEVVGLRVAEDYWDGVNHFVPVWVDFRVDRYLKGSGPAVFSGFDPVSVIFSDIEDTRAGDFDRAQFAGAGGACGALFEDPRGQYWVAAANLIDGNYRLSIPSVIAKGTGPSDPAILEALATAGVAPAAAGQGVPSTADRSTAPIVLSALALMLVGSARALTSKPAGRGRAR
ncbi:MAG: hypothetical protein H6674_03165 [Dehalococcoidia bacterium]|nr:hypothetical protein [Dehalococcoidia bacterium]